VRREKEGLRLHDTLPPGDQVVDVRTSRSRALAAAAGYASSAFGPKREKGRKNKNSAPRSAIGSSGSSVRDVSTVTVMYAVSAKVSDSG